ncbi:DUF2806 domain-containing protein [Lactococcus ileimucosae]|uniref:DUF2806 domain-containing protein n=1 Tax=Lactococcus ileimucosae TaxID=2941329 RepID=UPI002043F3D2|nr:DUF2806 domain-containing protein [Lactococcus ileimucosae]
MDINWFPEKFANNALDKLTILFSKLFPYVGVEKQALENYIASVEKSNLSADEKLFATLDAKKKIKEYQNQQEISKIAIENAKEGTNFSDSSNIDDEWLARFMDSAKFVTDKETQLLWGRVLAGEFEQPGTFPKQVVRILTELPVQLAQIFSNLSKMRVTMLGFPKNSQQPIFLGQQIFLPAKDINTSFKNLGINFGIVNELETFGLLHYDNSGYIKTIEYEQFPNIVLLYGSKQIKITKFPGKRLPTGDILLTDVGRSIASLVDFEEDETYLEKLKEYLKYKQVEFEGDEDIGK